MAPPLVISIPNATTNTVPKPHTVYTVSIRLPLTATSTAKRYSDFTSLHAALQSEAPDQPPPAALPPKHIFKSTVNNPTLTEERRQGLETYLQAIVNSPNPTWRNTSAWRTFLNLPASGAASLKERRDAPASLSDPSAWLDAHREVKSTLRDARTALTERERAETVKASHSAAADVKRCLDSATSQVRSMEQGLREMQIGEREQRRRGDLIQGLRKELDALESALAQGVSREESQETSAPTNSDPRREALFGAGGGGRRVLGGPARETDKTRELDNTEVLQLQKQIMQEQDSDVVDLTKVIQRMREMGVQINDELTLQNQMLDMLDQDVDRVEGKIGVAKRRIGKLK